MKRIFNISWLTIVVVGLMVSCQESLVDGFVPTDNEGYVSVSFKAQVPDMGEIRTRAVDPDGEDITKILLFCFNERGLFISVEEADLTTSSGTTGTYDVELPVVTDRVHFIANLHKTINVDDFLGMSESQVLSTMEGSSGMMTYWARVTKGTHADIKTALSADHNPVQLLRDHARVTVTDNSSGGLYEDLAFVVINTNAFGTVAPFYEGNWVAPKLDNMFITLPESSLRVTGNTDVVYKVLDTGGQYQYVFETENSSENPVCVIIRGTHKTTGAVKYFRVMLIDQNGEFVPIMRNFTYNVQITGEMDYGQDSFDAALSAPATNNIWLSVADDVKEISSSEYTLGVEETHIVLGEDDEVFGTIHKQLTVHYSLKSLTSTGLTAEDKPVITWLDGNDVAQQTIDASTFVISTDGKSAEGSVDITLLNLGDLKKREGTLLIKKGLLERRVKITTVAEQQFEPVWITTNIYGAETGSNVTMMFHVSEDCPQELFPLDVLVSVNDLDVRDESGMFLPIIKAGDEGYGKDNGIGYKYVFTVTEPGDQRLYLETILTHFVDETVEVTIEAEHFQSITKTATFQVDTDNRILIHNLRSYSAVTPADEVIYYYLVPQKINAEVEFDTHLGQVYETQPSDYDEAITDASGTYWVKYIAPNVDFDAAGGYNVDEFLLYSEHLDHNHDKPAGTPFYFDFYQFDESAWSESTAGRVMGFVRNTNPGTAQQGAIFHLKTNTPKADEVVRIASNPSGSTSITVNGTPGTHAQIQNYDVAVSTGTGRYKSVVFELSTFHPFHFSAQVKQGSTVLAGGAEYNIVQPETETILLSYEPGQSINVEFDVTSFKSNITDVASDDQLSVDPFGTEFEIYIDAPALELDEAAVAAAGLSGKIRKDPAIPGRVIYTVDADREAERTNGKSSLAALATDNATKHPVTRETITVDQTGERKSIPFLTKDIVSASNITISSDESKVVYYTKTFKIQNKPMTGTLTYGSSAAPIPADTFVPFSRVDDDTRIGVITIGENGTFSLRLRAEYEFEWDTPVQFECSIDGVNYKCDNLILSDVATAGTINLSQIP